MESDFESEMRDLLRYISPERREELEALVADVTFHEDDKDEGIGFSAVSNWKYVRVSMRCQSRLWAHCFAYFSAFTAFDAKRQGLSPQARYGVSDTDLTTAGNLLEWAVNTDVSVRKALREKKDFSIPEVPTGTPFPFDGQNSSFVFKVSEEIFLHALAFIIHHELAHVSLNHHGVEEEQSINQEYQADEAAASWLLRSKDMDELTYLVRHLGVAIALIWFTSIYFREKYEKRTHPPAWDRLLKAIEPTVRGEEDAIWGFVALALALHFHRHGLRTESLSEFAPTKATVVGMIALLEKFNESLGQA